VLEKLIEGDYYQRQFKLISSELSVMQRINSNLQEENNLLTDINKNNILIIESKDAQYADVKKYFASRESIIRKKNRKAILAAAISGVVLGGVIVTSM